MLESSNPILPLPKWKITKRRYPHVDRDHGRGWDVAGPLFKAGCEAICIVDLPNYKGGKHTPEYHIINLMIQGKMRFRFKNKTFTAKPGDLMYTPPGTELQRTGIGPITWLHIKFHDIPMWAPLKEIGPYVRKYESADLLYILTCRITAALRSQDLYSIQAAWESSEIIIKLLRREFRQDYNPWSSKRMSRFVAILDRIRQKPGQEWTRRILAQELNMSERNLTREFKRIFNMTPSQMVKNTRVDVASRMLLETDLKVGAIANAVGYDSPFSFSRIFSEQIGVSPSTYRELPKNKRQQLLS